MSNPGPNAHIWTRPFGSEFFTLDEMTVSQTAVRRGLDNTPGDEAFQALVFLCSWCLDQIRGRLGRPISVSSGYRSRLVNQAVGGVEMSQHRRGEAADFRVAGLTPRQAFEEIRQLDGLDFDQLILEYGRWIHVSYSVNRPKGNRREVWDFQDSSKKLLEQRGPIEASIGDVHWRKRFPAVPMERFIEGNNRGGI